MKEMCPPADTPPMEMDVALMLKFAAEERA
jgi:hypothetical protein